MIDKLLYQSGYYVDQNNIAYTDTPRVTGYFLVYIRLPQYLKNIFVNVSDIESILLTHIQQLTLPTLTIQKENMDHLLGSITKIPLSLDSGGQSSLTAYENIELDIINILYTWKSTLYNSYTYSPIIRKNFGESLMNKVKTTITAYLLPQNFVVNPDNIAIIKFYGALIDDINLDSFGTDVANNDVMKVTFNFSFDRVVLLTKETAPLLGLSDIYRKSLEALLGNVQSLTNNVVQPHIDDLTNLLMSLQDGLQALEATRKSNK